MQVRFAPFEEGRLVSCGDGNVNLWRLKRVLLWARVHI